MRYLSVCSGIEAATVAWHPLGWEPVAFCEIDPFPAAVLAQRFPEVPNHGDFTQLLDPDHPVRRQHVDLLVGGTPCQSFSVAGLRGGLEDPRGNLALAFVSLAAALRPRWVVWENVPGALSADRGRAFGSILGALEELGYGFAWRVLDAQYVRVDGYPRAVPQRRRRVFLVGHSGGLASRAAAVLFEPEGVFGDSPPRREAGAGAAGSAARGVALRGREGGATAELGGPVAGALRCGGGGGDKAHALTAVAALTARGVGTCGADDNQAQAGRLIPFQCQGTNVGAVDVPMLRSGNGHITGGGQAIAFHATQDPISHDGRAPCLSGGNKGGCASVAVATFPIQECQVSRANTRGTGTGLGEDGAPMYTLQAAQPHGVAHGMKVRRLTERECERLQGFPDDWTAIPWKGKPASECPSGHRYKALGNSMAVNVMRWLGQRIALVD